MRKNWLTISAITGLGIVGVLTIGVVSIANKIEYDVLSYHVLVLDDEGITFRVIFGITNPSRFDVDIWNQKYDVFIAGYKTLDITSKDKYKVFAGTTSSIPLDVRLKWKDFYNNSAPIGSVAQTTAIANLPIVIRGTLAAKVGVFRLTKIPVRMAVPLSYFLP